MAQSIIQARDGSSIEFERANKGGYTFCRNTRGTAKLYIFASIQQIIDAVQELVDYELSLKPECMADSKTLLELRSGIEQEQNG